MMAHRNFARLLWGLLILLAFVLPTGCVRRTVKINSDPQGARVRLNDEEIGTTPVSVDFIWYGDYDVILRKEGYDTLKTHHRLDAPWYQIPPIDFVAEAFVPFTIHDQQEMCFTMAPARPVSEEELVKEADELRERTLFGGD